MTRRSNHTRITDGEARTWIYPLEDPVRRRERAVRTRNGRRANERTVDHAVCPASLYVYYYFRRGSRSSSIHHPITRGRLERVAVGASASAEGEN